MKALRQALWIGCVALAAAGLTYVVAGPPSRAIACAPEALKPGEICLADVLARWPEKDRVLWVDARQRADWERDGVPGSILWNLTEDQGPFEIAAMERLADAPPVVVYCDSEHCGVSAQVAEKIRALGAAGEVRALHGGAEALKAAGLIK